MSHPAKKGCRKMANIIYNDLNESTFKFKYDDITFVFSSEFYLNNFLNRYNEYLKNENAKLYARYKTSIFADYLILIELYKKIEKRGFLVYYKDKDLKYYSFNVNIVV